MAIYRVCAMALAVAGTDKLGNVYIIVGLPPTLQTTFVVSLVLSLMMNYIITQQRMLQFMEEK